MHYQKKEASLNGVRKSDKEKKQKKPGDTKISIEEQGIISKIEMADSH